MEIKKKKQQITNHSHSFKELMFNLEEALKKSASYHYDQIALHMKDIHLHNTYHNCNKKGKSII